MPVNGKYGRDVIGDAGSYEGEERLEEARIVLVGRMRSRRREIHEAIFARVREGVFGLTGSGDPEYLLGLRDTIVAAVDHVLMAIENPGESLEAAPATTLEQARRSARMGVGLDTVLRRYVAGYALFEDFVMQEAERDDLLSQGTALRSMLGTAASLVERLITAVSSAYREEVERTGRAPITEDIPTPAQPRRSASRIGSVASGGALVSPEAIVGVQHARMLDAIVQVVAERGLTGASVGLVVERAKVSRRTFYEWFPGGLEDGLVAVMDGVQEQIGALVSQRLEEAGSWQDGVREAFAALLLFFDSDPELARVCFVEALGGGLVVAEHRERIVRTLRQLIVARIESDLVHVPPLAAEGVMASVMGVIYTRLIAREQGPLIELLGPLMGTVVTPLVASDQMATEEERRGDELAQAIQAGDLSWVSPPAPENAVGRPTLPAMFANPTARRARECLRFLAEHPDSSNREIAAGIGVNHKSQISKLLSYLLGEGLVIKRSEGAGKRNAWRLTPRGEEIARISSGASKLASSKFISRV